MWHMSMCISEESYNRKIYKNQHKIYTGFINKQFFGGGGVSYHSEKFKNLDYNFLYIVKLVDK